MSGKQIQRAGERSILMQGGTVQVGLSYSDARQIAQDVFDSNFLRLKGEAYELAKARMEEVTDQFLRTLLERKPEALDNARKPGAQRALYRVQEEYACSGDSQVADILVDILVERFTEGDRSFRQLVLDEALTTLPKLTMPQIATLSLVFYLQQVQNEGVEYHGAIAELHKHVASTLNGIGKVACSNIDLRHLEYCGCIALGAFEVSVGSVFRQRYPGAFSRGINPHSVPDSLSTLFPPHPSIPNMLHIPVVDQRQLRDYLAASSQVLSVEEEQRIRNLFEMASLGDEEVKRLVTGGDERLRELFAIWDETELKHAQPTSIGTAIGHANLRRTTPSFDAPLDVWLKDHGAR